MARWDQSAEENLSQIEKMTAGSTDIVRTHAHIIRAVDSLEEKFGSIRPEILDRDMGESAREGRLASDSVHDILVREANTDLWEASKTLLALQEEMHVNQAVRALTQGMEDRFRRHLGDETGVRSHPDQVIETARGAPGHGIQRAGAGTLRSMGPGLRLRREGTAQAALRTGRRPPNPRRLQHPGRPAQPAPPGTHPVSPHPEGCCEEDFCPECTLQTAGDLKEIFRRGEDAWEHPAMESKNPPQNAPRPQPDSELN